MNVLCVWELGNNLGHLTNLRMFIDEALERGHRVTVVCRYLAHVSAVLDVARVSLMQSPVILKKAQKTPVLSYAHMLHRASFSSESELEILTRAWRYIFDMVQPDLVIYDHSPTALIASLGQDWKKWVIGSGYLIPKTSDGLWGVLQSQTELDRQTVDTLRQYERSLLNVINQNQRKFDAPGLGSCDQLYRQADETLLLTLPVLDHFGYRKDARYLGFKNVPFGAQPSWPDGSGPRVFAYLNAFDNLDRLIDAALSVGCRLVLYGREFTEEFAARYRSKISISAVPLDITAVLRDADFVINHGNHGTVATTMNAGVPQLCIYTSLEQKILAERLVVSGGGVMTSTKEQDFNLILQALFELERVTVDDDNQRLTDPVIVSRKIASLFDQV